MAVSPARSSPARTAAFEILLRVERENSYASELLHSAPLATISTRDHGLATELVMGVLRWQSLLDQRLAAASIEEDRATGPCSSNCVAPWDLSIAISFQGPCARSDL